MAETYDELKRRVQLLIDRDDVEMQEAEDGTTVNMLDHFISVAERRFYRSTAAKIPPFEKVVTYSATTGQGVRELTIPEDYIEMHYMLATQDDGGRQFTLNRVSMDQVLNRDQNSTVGIPRTFAYGSGQWIVPHANQATEIKAYYYGALSPLSSVTSSDTAHWLLNRGDDLIVYWAAVEAGLYYESIGDNLVQAWDQRAQIIHDQIVEQEARQQASGSTPRQNRPYRSVRSRRFGFHF